MRFRLAITLDIDRHRPAQVDPGPAMPEGAHLGTLDTLVENNAGQPRPAEHELDGRPAPIGFRP